MFYLDGKYTHAKILTDRETIEQEALAQIQLLVNHPAMAGTFPVIMPDVHAGSGCVVGLTYKIGDYVIPQLIGVDIGCAISCAKFSKQSIDFAVLDKFICENIPAGFKHRTNNSLYSTNVELELQEAINYLVSKNEKSVAHPELSYATLGGGNHFIEVGESNDYYYLTVHTGSRKFGYDICTQHQRDASAQCAMYFFDTKTFRGLEFLPLTDGGAQYILDMQVAQRFAEANRKGILNLILNHLKVDKVEYIESVHNYIDGDGYVRKGAICAKNVPVIIPLNMRDGTIIGKGISSYDNNFSAPHGAGRTMSRTKARATVNMEDYKKSMDGIYSSCVTEATLDESPFAYKDKDSILKHLEGLVEVETIVKPVYNFKATDSNKRR